MAIIEVPDISIVKTIDGTKQLFSLRDQKVKKDGALHTFGTGSGIKHNGDLYVLKEDEPIELGDLLVEMEVTGSSFTFVVNLQSNNTSSYQVDWGDGKIESFRTGMYMDVEKSHTYSSTRSHIVKIYSNTVERTNLEINYEGNHIKSLNIPESSNLSSLKGNNCHIDSLYLNRNKIINTIRFNSCNLSLLNLEGCSSLSSIFVNNNNIEQLDVTGCDKLIEISIIGNPILQNEAKLIEFANSLPEVKNPFEGTIYIDDYTARDWIRDICNAKRWYFE